MEPTLWKNLQSILRNYKFRFLKSFLMLMISNCLIILNPLVFRQAVIAMDTTQEVENPNFLGRMLKGLLGPYISSLPLWIVLLLSIAVTASFFKYTMRLGFISISRDVERDVRLKIFEKIQSQSRAFYDHHGIGELLSRLTNDISAYRDVLGPGIMYPLFLSTLLIPGMIALFSISKMLAIATLLPLFLIPLINMTVRLKIYKLSTNVQESLATISNMTQEHFSANRIIKSYVIEIATFKRFQNLCRIMIGMNLHLSLYQGILFPMFTLLTKLTTVGLVLFSGWIILTAWSDLSAADFVSFMWIQSYIFFPILMLAWILPIYERGRASYDRLVEIYQEPKEVQEGSSSTLEIPTKADISFNHLKFTYPDADIPSLKDIHLTIKGGTFVGITGPIGAGKSTLFSLLNRDYEIPKGMITIAGKDIHEYPLQAFSESMVTVEQMPFLFSKTIEENLKFGNELASDEELFLVSQRADLHNTVMEFPQRYNTIVGERGVTLSGGQKQRIAMARAFLVKRSILLLDDIFSAVDTGTERRIFDSMKGHFDGKTVLLITHRVSILEQLDRVIYIKEGVVLEDGPPQQLLSQKGPYSALAELQRLNGVS